MKKISFIFCTLFAVLFFYSTPTLQAQEADEPYVVIAQMNLDENYFDQVVDLLSELQQNTLENEEGCVVFDVLLVEDDFTKIFIYESYENASAYQAHTNSAYYKRIVNKELKSLIKQETKTKVFPLNFESEMDEGE